ncbi:Rieske 2Fe-2S domain-containing protein [Rhodospirillaceae bacterium SYSU D60014]|uniref:Rieske (2Fe-2S) protein n=1 Tax=Virgifigura deserti TaxID=2268457 RepID=UPI000E65EBF3
MSAAATGRPICRLGDLAEGETKGFSVETSDGPQEIFLLRRNGRVIGYVNSCPHLRSPLDWVPNRFLSADGRHVLCATHGALFRIEDGYCVAGPCAGASLTQVELRLRGDEIVMEP